ncbi:MAG: hypothetical protein NTX25_09785, partial [Proteobacteria bacterium]|nr:hypothetical protein [Pseudomonadota bacterium]
MNKALVYFAAALLPVLAIVLGQGPLLSLQSRFHDAKEQYQQALQTSRMQLLELGHELHKDPALAQNLDQQVFATVSRILSGYAVAGKIDYLAILDDHCQFVAHSEQGILLSSDCPVANLNGMEKEQFQWRALAKYPSLDLVIPMGQFGERAYFLLASSWIRDQWLFQFPLLHQSA